MAEVTGIGLSGQMHGAVLLDRAGAVLRPAILWNDGRSAAECASWNAASRTCAAVTGNLAMPGFTAPKLLWVRRHEPAVFAAIDRVLLPKAYLRYRLTGELHRGDVGRLRHAVARCRRARLVRRRAGGHRAARAHMPRLVEGSGAGRHAACRSSRGAGA